MMSVPVGCPGRFQTDLIVSIIAWVKIPFTRYYFKGTIEGTSTDEPLPNCCIRKVLTTFSRLKIIFATQPGSAPLLGTSAQQWRVIML
jgi:hypothetical protein